MSIKNESLFSSLLDIITELEKEAYIFYKSINSNNKAVFFDNEDFAKRYKKEFNIFSVVLANHISKCEQHVLSLTLLISKADQENNTAETVKLFGEFEKYLKFSESISDFIRQNETVIKENTFFDKNQIIILIQNLLTSIQIYKEELQPND